jgi:hypothetical protein
MTLLILQSFSASCYVITIRSNWSQHPVLELSSGHTSLRETTFHKHKYIHTHTHTHTHLQHACPSMHTQKQQQNWIINYYHVWRWITGYFVPDVFEHRRDLILKLRNVWEEESFIFCNLTYTFFDNSLECQNFWPKCNKHFQSIIFSQFHGECSFD